VIWLNIWIASTLHISNFAESKLAVAKSGVVSR
jgi:hypothetical protein